MKKIMMSVYAVAIVVMLSNVNAFCMDKQGGQDGKHVCGSEWIKQVASKLFDYCKEDCKSGAQALTGADPAIMKSLAVKLGIGALSYFNGPLAVLGYSALSLRCAQEQQTEAPKINITGFQGEIFTTVVLGAVLAANEFGRRFLTTKKEDKD